jgi:DNA-binding response OmpR family regulator
MKILVIEDESKIARALKEGLEREHFDVQIAPDGEEGLFQVSSRQFDLIVLDLNLPGHDGIEVLRTMRGLGILVPVLILTARETLANKVAGLEAGADDYLVKPFAFPELVARIRAALRRGHGEYEAKHFIADLEMDVLNRRVSRAGCPIQLTAREFELLRYLLRNKNGIVTRDMIVTEIWKDIGRVTALDNVIDVHIAHLRRKIDDGHRRKLLHTIRGVGFRLSDREC